MGDKSPEQKQETFADKVNEVVNNMTQGEDGKWALPEGDYDEAILFAANTERRRRDTQSAYTRSQQKLKSLEAENELLAQNFEDNYVQFLPTDKQAELEELKATDPDAWRAKLSDLERERREEFQTKRSEIKEKAKGESEADYRARALTEFQEQNPELKLTDDVIQNDIPPRITKQLEKGDITFAEFLSQCGEYLSKGKVVAPPADKAPNNPNLGKVPGGSAPSGDAVASAVTKSYNEEIY